MSRVRRSWPFERTARFSIQVGRGNWWITFVGRSGLRVCGAIVLIRR